MSDETNYVVGYKKPPATSRFKKGQSGNPSGKKKEDVQDFDPGRIVQAIDNEVVEAKIGEKRVRITRVEARLRELFNRALKGDLKEARQVVLLAAQYFGPEAHSAPDIRLVVAPDEYFHPRQTDEKEV